MLVAGDCPWQESPPQPVQRRVTPCSTVFAHVMPGFLPLAPPMLIFFALKIKHIAFKTPTEPPLLAGAVQGLHQASPLGASTAISGLFPLLQAGGWADISSHPTRLPLQTCYNLFPAVLGASLA